jgi:hypothetical protein
MPFSDYIPDNIVTRGVARPLAALADYYMANRQQPVTPQQTIAPQQAEVMDPNMGYPLTPQQEAMYAQASPRRVVQLTPEELAAFNAQRSAVDTSYSGSGANFGPEQPVPAQPQAPVQPEIAQETPAKVYPADEHELRRKKAFEKIAGANRLADAMIQQNVKNASTIKDSLERNIKAFIPEEQLKPFEETPNYKKAQEFAYSNDFTKKAELIDVLEQEINNAEKYSDPKEKSRYLLTNAVKVINNIISADAITGSELMYKFPELLSSPENAALMGKGEFNPTIFRAKLNTSEGKNLAERIGNAFSTNPDAALRKMKEIHDSVAVAHNKAAEKRIINPTSPSIAASWGIEPINLFGQMEQQPQIVRPSATLPSTPPQGSVRRIR